MSDAVAYYVITLLVYMGCNVMFVLGLNLQFGLANIINFSYYILVAVGGYFAGLVVLGPPQPVQSGGTEYLFGWTLPWPLPVAVAGLTGAALALLVGIVAVRRLRSDYLAVATLVVGEVTWLLTGNTTSVVNGWNGLTGIPQPLADTLNLPQIQYQWVYLGIVLGFALLSFLIMQRLTHSPFGRSLRAIRENEYTAAACGKDVFRLRMTAMMIGGAIAAVGGALFIEFIGTVQPSMWNVPETFVIFAALIVGGRGNNWGAVLGAILVPVAFLEGSRLLPQDWINPNLIDPLRWIIIGSVLILVLYFRPQGIFPEPKRRFRKILRQLAVDEGSDRQINRRTEERP
ncbi:MAG TPA: branched-chain amino acid ABC transporter permease [Chloroflexota bacterium]|jgi:ABC-type branched-subunit amino acid transport system permease subunit